KGCGIASKILFAAQDVTVRMLRDPAMVEASVVRHKVENQPHASSSQPVVHFAQAFGGGNTMVGTVVLNRERRTDYAMHFPGRQCGIEIRKISRVGTKDSAADPTPLPHSHQVHKIESQAGEAVPFFVRHVLQTQATAMLGGKFF